MQNQPRILVHESSFLSADTIGALMTNQKMLICLQNDGRYLPHIDMYFPTF